MRMRIRESKGVSILDISEKIDIHSAEIIEVTGGLLKYGKVDILCNFKGVTQVDHDGLSVLVIAYKNVINRKGRMKFCNVPSGVMSLLKMVHLDTIFEIYNDEKSALRSFRGPATSVDRKALRRRFKRLDIHVNVKYSLLARPKPAYESSLSNISGAGIYIKCKKTYPIKTKLYLLVKLPEVSEPLKLVGMVVWNADKQIQPHEYPGMGIRFTDISSDEQRQVLDFIDKNISHRSGKGFYTA